MGKERIIETSLILRGNRRRTQKPSNRSRVSRAKDKHTTENRPESTSAIPESAAPRKSGKLGRTNPAPDQKTAQPVGAEPRKASRPRKDKKTPEDGREYERLRGQRPERREARRKATQARRQKAKELGLCRDCSNKAITGQSMCEACAEKHRQARRKDDTARRARLKAERELNNQTRPQTPATQEGSW